MSQLSKPTLKSILPKVDANLFEQAFRHAQEYMETVDDRPVFPKEEAIKKLEIFDEQLPDQPGSAQEILNLLF